MANKYRRGDAVVIRDGDVHVTLIDDNHQKHQIDVLEGTPGIVSEVVFGGSVYLVRVTVANDGNFVTATGMFAEWVLSEL